MKRLFTRVIRRVASAVGLELIHQSNEPLQRALLAARETLRVSPDLPAWKREFLLADIAAQAHLQALLRELEIDCVIDVGANHGQFARRLRQLGYEGPIACFEPMGRARNTLEQLAASDPMLRVYPFALGDAEGEFELNVFRDDTFSSLKTANARGRKRFGDCLVVDHVERVKVNTLDAAAKFVPSISPGVRILLKTDTQGNDLAVLRGARHTLSHTHVVLTEAAIDPIYQAAGTFDDVAALLRGAGFRPSSFYPISHDTDLSLIEMDCYFVRSAAWVSPE